MQVNRGIQMIELASGKLTPLKGQGTLFAFHKVYQLPFISQCPPVPFSARAFVGCSCMLVVGNWG